MIGNTGISTSPQASIHVADGTIRIDDETTIPVSNHLYGNSMPMAYGYISGTSIATDYGITSVTNPSTGNYVVTLNLSFDDPPVVMITCFNNSPGDEVATYHWVDPNIIHVHISDGAGTAKSSNFSIVVFGN